MLSFRKKILIAGAVIFLLLSTSVIAISYISSGKLVSPPREEVATSPQDVGMAFEKVKYTTSDQVIIRGWFIPAERKKNDPNQKATIILAHGYTHNRAQMNDYAAFLHQRGFNVLAFDFRGHGKSGGAYTTLGVSETLDIDGAVDWLKKSHPAEAKKIGILGISMGGAAAIRAAAQNHGIDAIVADSAFARLSNAVDSSFSEFAHLPAFLFSPITIRFAEVRTHVAVSRSTPVESIAAIAPRPVLLIHSKADKTILLKNNGLPLYQAANEPKSLWAVDGGGHVKNLEFARTEYAERVDQFFESAFKPDLQKTEHGK